MGKSVGLVYGLLSVSHGLAEGDSKVAGLCPSVFACAPLVCCVHPCITCKITSVISPKCAAIHQS